MASGGNRKRDRSRSPVNNAGRRRGGGGGAIANKSMEVKADNSMINSMMMNNMYQQGNMLMSGMYPNMMMAGGVMGNGMGNMDMSAMAAGMGTGMTGNMAAGMTGNMAAGMTATGMTGGMATGLTGGMATGITGGIATGMTGSMDMGQQPMEMSPMGQSMTPAITTGTIDMTNMNMMGGMMMDPSMMAMGMYPNMTGDMMQVPEKKEIILKSCKLTPPAPGTADPPRREKPNGCRTIFVGGLPDKIKESIMREIFEMYGHIHTLRLSKKNFCHIRFDREAAVDAAMRISGYRIKLIEKENEEEEDTHSNSGWIHVDYALSRDDQNEFERRHRQMLRVQQQQMMSLNAQNDGNMMGMGMDNMEMAGMDMGRQKGRSRRRSPSPVRIQPFSNAAVGQLIEKVKSEEHFYSSLPTLLSWLERGECSKKNATQFYSMIQATNSHIRRLFNEKMQSEEELQDCKERVKNKIEMVINQLEQVAKVFSAASHQRVWDHFTKPQRKNIETWQKMTQEFAALKDEFKEKFDNDENDFGNGNSYGMSNQPLAIGAPSYEEVQQYKMENDSLKFQLEAYKNEVDVIKSDAKKEMEKFKAQFIARQALQGSMDIRNPPLPEPVEKPPPPPPLPDELDCKVHLKQEVEAGCGEAKLIGVMAAFLQVHPQGASLDYVVSYVRALFPHVSQATVHHVLQKHDDVFQRVMSGVGANIENRWSFVAFARAPATP